MPGSAAVPRTAIPGSKYHLSTQAGVHGEGAVRLAADELGVERDDGTRAGGRRDSGARATGCAHQVFLPRCDLHRRSGVRVRPRRGRSAMRGDCTQPCRSAMILAWTRRAALSPSREIACSCPRDYLGSRICPELCRCPGGVAQIEGRMKNPDYVFNVVRVWRRALDMLCDGAWDPGAVEEACNRAGPGRSTAGLPTRICGAFGAELMSFAARRSTKVCAWTPVAVGHEEVTVERRRRGGG